MSATYWHANYWHISAYWHPWYWMIPAAVSAMTGFMRGILSVVRPTVSMVASSPSVLVSPSRPVVRWSGDNGD